MTRTIPKARLAQVPPVRRRVLDALISARGFTCAETLASIVYPDHPPAWPATTIRVHCNLLRDDLAGLPVRIENARGRGYRLVAARRTEGRG